MLSAAFRAEFLGRCASRVRRNHTAGVTEVSTIAQTPAFVAARMVRGRELDSYCTGQSTDPWVSVVD